jgi:hypothetical protein
LPVCAQCGYRRVAPGKQKYCHDCAPVAKTVVRRERRLHLKTQGIPAWQRNGWASEEQYRQYHRQYMQGRRSRELIVSHNTSDAQVYGKPVPSVGRNFYRGS